MYSQKFQLDVVIREGDDVMWFAESQSFSISVKTTGVAVLQTSMK